MQPTTLHPPASAPTMLPPPQTFNRTPKTLHYVAWAFFIGWAALVTLASLSQNTINGSVAGIFFLFLGFCLAHAVSELCK